MRRRPFLASCTVGALGLAGCLSLEGPSDGPGAEPEPTPGGGPPDGPEPPETDDGSDPQGPFAIGETASVPGVGDVTVESVAVKRSVIHHHLWRVLYEPEDAQMVVVEADYEGEEELAFVAELDGEAVESAEQVRLTSIGSRYALSVPVRSADHAIVRLESGDRPAWELPSETRERLAAAPEFHLHEATIGEVDGGTVLELAVENTGDRDGTFRAIVASAVAADADAAVQFPVPAGETVEETVDDSVVGNWQPDDEFEHDVGPDTRYFAVDYP